MEVFLIKALQLILCFSILILLHEGGHFFFAKLFKVRVEKFCLFFDPWKTLLRFKPKRGDTEYCLGWLPLGGYVKIAGMIDESMDREQMKQPPQPWEFRSKPAWQRLLIMLGGVMVNFLLALFIYSMILFCWGEDYVPMQDMSMGMQFNSEAKALGFRDGDILVRTDAQPFRNFDSREGISNTYRQLSRARWVQVLRNGREVTIDMPQGGLNMLDMFRQQPPFVLSYMPFRVDSVLAGSPAAQAGMRKGDRVVAFNGTATPTWNDYNYQVAQLSQRLVDAPTDDSLALRHVSIAVQRAQGMVDTLQVLLTEQLTMGVVSRSLYSYYKPVHKDYGILASLPAGVRHGSEVLGGYVKDLKYIFTKEGAQSVGSFGAIGSMFPAQWSWHRFWELTAFISIILAFMNILPIPALDGGHVLFLLYEIIFRRKPGDKFLERAEMVGLGLLILLMVFAIRNDIVNFLLK
ncbi:MAG: RIP metalloprotease RseP [Bacteroidaceae bacterium]|nr:RIP metalloprotease RseP [Bacteroidaceae bacterium]